MVWISSISKSISKTSKLISLTAGLLLLMGGGVSCSSKSPVKKGKIIRKKVKKIVGDPSLKTPLIKGFKNVTESLGLQDVKGTLLYSVDWNGDGVTDLVSLPEAYGFPEFFEGVREKNSFHFVNRKSAPLSKGVRASFLAFADFNKDGRLDMIVATFNQKTELNRFPLRLFLGQKEKDGIFFKEERGAFPNQILPVVSLSLIDVDMDGWLDVFVGNWFDNTKKESTVTPDRLYLARPGGRKWIDGSIMLEEEHKFDEDYKIYPNARPTTGSTTCDIDRNGYPDLLTASSSGQKNKVWLNSKGNANADRLLIDHAKEMGVDADKEGSYLASGGGFTHYLLCHDYNSDGLFDLALGELFHSYDPETRDRSSILTGKSFDNPPQFLRTEYHKDDGSGSWSQGDRRAIWADFNFDGHPDLLVGNSGFPPKSRLIYFEQAPDHSMKDIAHDLGIDIVNPSGMVAVDFNKDGRLDIISGQVSFRNAAMNPRLYAFENQFPYEKRRILKVRLKGVKANTMGIGATVRLKTNKGSFLRTVDYSYGPMNSQNEEGLWFGLGAKEKVESIEVRWPYLVKTKRRKPYPLRKIYSLKKYQSAQDIVLHEDGSVLTLN